MKWRGVQILLLHLLDVFLSSEAHTDTDTHSDIGFQLTQFPGKMAMERKGGRVREKVWLNKSFAKRSSESGDQRLQSGGETCFGVVA